MRYTLVGPADAVTISVELEDADAQVLMAIYTEDGESVGEVLQNEIESLPLSESFAGERLILEIGTADDDVTTGFTVSLNE
ncbi:MAG: hypothetical protein AAF125_06160 [Chloroflexota bacterium]